MSDITGDADILICPIDKTRIDEFFPDKFYQREMLDRGCHCCFRDKGCTWEGIVGGLDKHESDCDYADVVCPECSVTTSRKNFKLHQRDDCEHRLVSCQYCFQYVKLKQMDDHRLQCLDIPLECPRACSATNILRRTLEDHLSSHCPNAIHSCQLADYGCTFRGTRKEQEEHRRQSIDLHLMFLAKSDKEKQNVITNLVEQNCKLQQKIERCESVLDNIGEVTDALQKMFEADKPTMETEKIQVLATQMDEVLQFIRSQAASTKESQGNSLSWDPYVMRAHERRISVLENSMGFQESVWNNIVHRLQRVENDSVNVSFLWKIDNVKEVMEKERRGEICGNESPPFNVSRCGYKFCARAKLNGDGRYKGSHMSVFFAILRGDHDDFLQWPFLNKVYIRLLNQNGKENIERFLEPDPNDVSFQKPASRMNLPYGFQTFCTLDELLDPRGGLLVKDTIYFLITVDIRSMPPFLLDHL